jgi:hypothetical protein
VGPPRRDPASLLLNAISPVRGKRGRPRYRPQRLYADRGYDYDKYLRLLWERGIKPVIARRGSSPRIRPWRLPLGGGTNAWIHGFRRLRIRWEARDDIREAFLKLACCIMVLRRVRALRELQ